MYCCSRVPCQGSSQEGLNRGHTLLSHTVGLHEHLVSEITTDHSRQCHLPHHLVACGFGTREEQPWVSRGHLYSEAITMW